MKGVHAIIAATVVIGMAACSPAPIAEASPHASSPVPVSPSVLPAATPSPAPPVAAVQPSASPAAMQVAFTGLPEGTYATHLHSICSGSQNFHILVLQSLVVGADGSGSIQVPPSYLGRGLCLIVYSVPSLALVLTTREI